MPKKKGEARVTITLACGDCRERNYTTEKNKNEKRYLLTTRARRPRAA